MVVVGRLTAAESQHYQQGPRYFTEWNGPERTKTSRYFTEWNGQYNVPQSYTVQCTHKIPSQ